MTQVTETNFPLLFRSNHEVTEAQLNYAYGHVGRTFKDEVAARKWASTQPGKTFIYRIKDNKRANWLVTVKGQEKRRKG